MRDRYRERLLNFRLDTLPHYKHRLQSRIFRFLVERERKRREKSRIIDLVYKHSRTLLLPRAARRSLLPGSRQRPRKDVNTRTTREKMQSQRGYGYGYGAGGGGGGGGGSYGYGYGGGGGGGGDAAGEASDLPHERGSRRRKLAAMAGTMYRAGVAAASEIREQYNNTRIRGLDTSDELQITIPGSFPDVAIVVRGDDQMVLFPSYAKRHVRETKCSSGNIDMSGSHADMNDEEYWHHEWAKLEDEKAVVDVDVRGWVYTPHKGPLNRKNRLLVGLARRLSGIPPPTLQGGADQDFRTPHEEHEEMREQQRIAKEAEQIEKRGQGEKEVANRGGYSEPPKEDDSDADAGSFYHRAKSGATTPGGGGASAPTSPTLAPKSSWNTAADLTEAELAVANANLMARLGPFLTTPHVQLPVTIFFYNDTQSQSRTVMTNEAGHFSMRAALEFVPTHVRVLANEDLSAIEPVRVIEDRGVSVISDIDDTIKKSNISLGAHEIFRNTFIRDLADLTVQGTKDWYLSLYDMGVQFHYCSNSPWQLFPVLATFFKTSGLPPGTLHLKQYSGMLQGIFEPVAERKKGTLEKIMRDFPQRKFLLVGDSGEADLEVYTDLVIANPGRILAVFIRDVTTPEQAGYFDAAIDPTILRRKAPAVTTLASPDFRGDDPSARPALPPRVASEPPMPDGGPAMGTLIDLSDEPQQMSSSDIKNLSQLKRLDNLRPGSSALDLLGRKPPPPPRPAKPLALRGSPSDSPSPPSNGDSRSAPPPPPAPRRKPTGPISQRSSGPHPLAQMVNSSDPKSPPSAAANNGLSVPSAVLPKSASSASLAAKQHHGAQPPPPPPRRRGTPTSSLNLSPRLSYSRRVTANSDVDFDPLPPPASGAVTPNTAAAAAINRKVELWRRRLARAHDTLEHHGVRLYTWRHGSDVVLEAVGIVREALRDLEKEKGRK